jgi:hypothetical protein
MYELLWFLKWCSFFWGFALKIECSYVSEKEYCFHFRVSSEMYVFLHLIFCVTKLSVHNACSKQTTKILFPHIPQGFFR